MLRVDIGDNITFTITYMLPIPATPFTNAMATDRLAGGRGIEFATHTSISILPMKQKLLTAMVRSTGRTTVANSHQEQ